MSVVEEPRAEGSDGAKEGKKKEKGKKATRPATQSPSVGEIATSCLCQALVCNYLIRQGEKKRGEGEGKEEQETHSNKVSN